MSLNFQEILTVLNEMEKFAAPIDLTTPTVLFLIKQNNLLID